MEYTIEKYDLKLIDNEDNTCKTELSPKEGAALLKERRKLYIVYLDEEVLYVGEAHTSIKTRFQRGCNAYNYYKKNNDIARGGYKGYKWLNKIDNSKRKLKVVVATFSVDYDSRRDFIEAIEGELVYLIRQNTGRWPEFQNEIHFSNVVRAREIAESILEKMFSKELV